MQMHPRIRVYARARVRVCVCSIHVYIYACIYACMSVRCMYVHMYTCVYVCMRVYMVDLLLVNASYMSPYTSPYMSPYMSLYIHAGHVPRGAYTDIHLLCTHVLTCAPICLFVCVRVRLRMCILALR